QSVGVERRFDVVVDHEQCAEMAHALVHLTNESAIGSALRAILDQTHARAENVVDKTERRWRQLGVDDDVYSHQPSHCDSSVSRSIVPAPNLVQRNGAACRAYERGGRLRDPPRL